MSRFRRAETLPSQDERLEIEPIRPDLLTERLAYDVWLGHRAIGGTALMLSTTPAVTAGFLIPKSSVIQTVTVDGRPVRFALPTTDAKLQDAVAPAFPPPPDDADPSNTAPLIQLAWARSGDKGNLFNVAVIARAPEYLPYIAAALTPETVGAHYGQLLAAGRCLPVDRFSVPGLSALNFVVRESMDGGVLASMRIDPVAKGMAQLLLDFPIPVSAAVLRQCGSAR